MIQLISSRLARLGCQKGTLPATLWPLSDQCCQFNSAITTNLEDTAFKRKALLNKLLYRSKQRGFLELDLLVGLWAEKNLPVMADDMLQHYAVFLDQENPDLFKWLTGQQQPPEDMLSNPAFQAIRQHVMQQTAQKSQPATLASQGSTWVRGWDDSWRKPATQHST